MTQTVVLAPQTAAGDSGDIVVGASPVTLILYAADGVVDDTIRCGIYRKVGSNYQPEPDDRGYNAALSSDRLSVVFDAPGTFKCYKPETTENVGFATDTV